MSLPNDVTTVVLDTGPLGLLCNPNAKPLALDCNQWAATLIATGVDIVVPEIADYELRRELLQAERTRSLSRLDATVLAFDYAPLTTSVMRRAAQLWAMARRSGRVTADIHALDGDVILAAQVESLGLSPSQVVVATTNPPHLRWFVAAELWTDLSPVP